MPDLTAATILRRAEGHLACDLDGDKVLLHLTEGSYFHMTEVAGRLWELLDTPVTAETLVQALRQEYDVSEAQCRQEVLAVLADMEAFGLVTV